MRALAVALATIVFVLTGCTSTDPAGTAPATSAAVDLKAELSTFIAKRGADQGKEAGALLLAEAMKTIAKNGTEYTITAEFSPLFVAAEAPKQLAYLVGVFDPQATKVTITTPGGQELFAGAPPKEPISGSSPGA